MQPVVVYPNKKWLRSLIGGCLAVVVLSVALSCSMAYTAATDIRLSLVQRIEGGLEAMLFFVIGTPFFGLSFLQFAARLKSGQPAMIVNKTGLLDNASWAGLGQIQWDELEAIYPGPQEIFVFGRRLLKKQHTMIVFRDINALCARLPLTKVWLLVGPKFFKQWRVSWILIPQEMLTITPDEFIERLNVFYSANVQEQNSA